MKKIAVLRANKLGDFIFALPAIYALKNTYKDSEIILLGKPWHKEFLKNRVSPIDQVTVIPVSKGVREEKGKAENPKELKQFFQQMQKEQFDIAIQMHGGGKYSNPFILGLGAKLTIGLKTPDAAPLNRWIPYIYYQNEILRHLEVVSLIGAKTTRIEPQIIANENDHQEADKFIKKLNKPFVIIHPGATDIKRRWSVQKFAQIADALKEKGYPLLITGTNSEKEVTDKAVQLMNRRAINLCGRLSLSALTGVLSKASLVISNDTGALHLATALGTPTVGIYWAPNLILWAHPTSKNHRALSSWVIHCPVCGASCLPAQLSSRLSSENRNRCLHEVSFVDEVKVEDVLSESLNLLSSL